MLELAAVSAERTSTQRFIDHLASLDLIEHIGYDFLKLGEEERRSRLVEYAEAHGIDPESINLDLLARIPETENFIEYLKRAYEEAGPQKSFTFPDPREGLTS